MLEDLNGVDWIKLRTPQAPKWLREIGSSSQQEVRMRAYNDLQNLLVPWARTDVSFYDGNLLDLVQQQVLSHIIPFLIELLTYDSTQEKVRILILLYDIASYIQFADYVSATERAAYNNRAQQIFESVAAGTNVYTRLLESSDEEVRAYAQRLLSLLNEAAG